MAISANAREEYLKQKIETASPIGRIVILIEAAMRFLNQAQTSFKNGDKLGFVEKVIRAQNIVRELRNSLNLDIDENIGCGFYRLYSFFLKEMMKAVREKKTEPLITVQVQLKTLCDSWRVADEQGLGRDVAPFEARVSAKDGKLVGRRVEVTEAAYKPVSQGLNLIS